MRTELLRESALRRSFSDPLLSAMNILNEVVERHSNAISFAPGRPSDEWFSWPESREAVDRFVAHRSLKAGQSANAVFAELGQYGPTKGLINDLIARHLALDENVSVEPNALVVTAGAQEAMAVLMSSLFDPDKHSLLATDPGYIGMTALARLFGIQTCPVHTENGRISSQAIESAIQMSLKSGRTPRAMYVTPDFSNPLGTTLSLTERLALLRIAHENNFDLIEDNAYGLFNYDESRLSTLKSLDQHSRVIYIGSFSKVLYPGLRIGFLVADQEYNGRPLAEELSKAKSLLSVNTSPITQAIAGGLLLSHDCSLTSYASSKVKFYRRKRDLMLDSLQSRFACEAERGEISWNKPAGGFFITIRLPFEFDMAALERCAAIFGVIVCPLSMFSLQSGSEKGIRLSFSYVAAERIHEGIGRLYEFYSNIRK